MALLKLHMWLGTSSKMQNLEMQLCVSPTNYHIRVVLPPYHVNDPPNPPVKINQEEFAIL